VLEFVEGLRGGFVVVVEVFPELETAGEGKAGGVECWGGIADAFAAFAEVFSHDLEELCHVSRFDTVSRHNGP